MSEVSDLIQQNAVRLFEKYCTVSELRSAEEGHWPEQLWQSLEDMGLPKAMVPEDAGGIGIEPVDALRVIRIAARFAAPVPLAETMYANWLASGYGLEMPDGPVSFAPTQAGDVLQIQRSGDGWTLYGKVRKVPWGRHARALVIAVQCGDGTALAVVPASAWSITEQKNLAGEPRDDLTLSAALPATAVHLDPDTDLVGAIRLAGAAIRSLQIAGALSRVLEMTGRYTEERSQFGKPIGKFQAVQQNLAILASQTAASMASSDSALEALAEGLVLLPIAAAKARSGEAASIAAALTHQIHGAMGFTHEHSLHFYTRRLWSWRDEFGHEAEWNGKLGRAIATAGADRVWETITASGAQA